MSRYAAPIDPDDFPELTVVIGAVAQSGRRGRFERLAVICEGTKAHVLGRVYQTGAGLAVIGVARRVEDRGVRFTGWGAPPGGVRTIGNYSRVPTAYRLADADPDDLVRLQCPCRDVSIPVSWMLGAIGGSDKRHTAVFYAVPAV